MNSSESFQHSMVEDFARVRSALGTGGNETRGRAALERIEEQYEYVSRERKECAIAYGLCAKERRDLKEQLEASEREKVEWRDTAQTWSDGCKRAEEQLEAFQVALEFYAAGNFDGGNIAKVVLSGDLRPSGDVFKTARESIPATCQNKST